jgi:hypothetical protein
MLDAKGLRQQSHVTSDVTRPLTNTHIIYVRTLEETQGTEGVYIYIGKEIVLEFWMRLGSDAQLARDWSVYLGLVCMQVLVSLV